MLSILEIIKGQSPENITILCGAGISYEPPTCLPTVHSFTTRILEEFGADKKTIEQVTYKIKNMQVFPRFESLIDDIRKDLDPELHLSQIFSSEFFNKTHLLLASLILHGVSVVTTNFDICIENALGNVIYNNYIFNGKDLDPLEGNNLRGVVVKPHGSIGQDNRSLVISVEALAKTDRGFLNYPNWRKLLLDLFSKELVVVIGYSGSDDFDITPILQEAKPKQLVWLYYVEDVDIPQLMNEHEAQRLSIYNSFSILPLKIYKGRLNYLVEQLLTLYPFQVKLPVATPKLDAFKNYVRLKGNTASQRKELINTVLWHYQLYDLVIKQNEFGKSSLMDFQLIKSLYSSGHYTQIIDALNKTHFTGHPYELTMLYYYSSCLYYTGRLLESIKVAESLIEKIQETDDTVFKIDLYNHLAGLYESNKNLEKAGRNYQIALSLNQSGSISGYATSQWGLGDISLIRRELPQALEYYEEAISTFDKLGSHWGLAFMNLNLAEVHIKMAQFEQAREHLDLAESFFSSLNHKVGLILVFNAFVALYYTCSQYQNCEQFLKKAQTVVSAYPSAPPAIYTHMLRLMIYINSAPSPNELKDFSKSVRKEISILEDSEDKEFLYKQLALIEKELCESQEIKQNLESWLLQ